MVTRTGITSRIDGIPIDLVHYKVDVPEIAPLELSIPKNPETTQQVALRVVVDAINKAKHPVVVVDGCVLRHQFEKPVDAFLRRTGFPAYVAPMGKGAVDESLPNYRGCYAGNTSLEEINKEIHEADLVIEIGAIKSDFNTGNFSYNLNAAKTITLHSFATIAFCAEYSKVSMLEFLPLLTEALPKTPRSTRPRSSSQASSYSRRHRNHPQLPLEQGPSVLGRKRHHLRRNRHG